MLKAFQAYRLAKQRKTERAENDITSRINGHIETAAKDGYMNCDVWVSKEIYYEVSHILAQEYGYNVFHLCHETPIQRTMNISWAHAHDVIEEEKQ